MTTQGIHDAVELTEYFTLWMVVMVVLLVVALRLMGVSFKGEQR